MATIADIRSKYPQYEDMSDRQLADAIYAKHYSDMPKADFYQKVGLTTGDEAGLADDIAEKLTFGLSQKAAGLGTALGGELGELLGGKEQDFSDRYKTALANEQTKLDAYREDRPVLTTATAPLALLGGGGVAKTALAARRAATVAGGVTGGLEAAGEPDATPGSIALGTGVGAVVGNAAARVLPKVTQAGSRVVQALRRPGSDEGRELVSAGARQGVSVLPADVAPGARNTTAFLESVPGASGPIQRGTDRGIDQLGAAVTGIGSGKPVAATTGALGEKVQEGARRFKERTRGIVDALYRRAETLAGDAAVRPVNAVAALDANIAELAKNPNTNKAALSALQEIRADLVDEAGRPIPKEIQSLRDLRTQVRSTFQTNGLRATDAERRALEAVAAVTDDISRDLASKPAAVLAYKKADRAHAVRVQRIDTVVKRLLGTRNAPVSPETAIQRINTLAARDSNGLKELLKTVGEDARDEVAGTIADNLGKRADDAAFSPAKFLQDIRKITPEARVALWGDKGASALADLSKLAQAKVASGAALNRSRSGQVGNYADMIKMGLGIGGYAAGGPLGVVGAVGLGNLSGRLMASPRFAAWLARGARLSAPIGSAATRNHVGALSAIAAKDPTIRNEVLALQQRLQEALNATPMSAAAEGDQEGAQ